jgi:hypothetical protein
MVPVSNGRTKDIRFICMPVIPVPIKATEMESLKAVAIGTLRGRLPPAKIPVAAIEAAGDIPIAFHFVYCNGALVVTVFRSLTEALKAGYEVVCSTRDGYLVRLWQGDDVEKVAFVLLAAEDTSRRNLLD